MHKKKGIGRPDAGACKNVLTWDGLSICSGRAVNGRRRRFFCPLKRLTYYLKPEIAAGKREGKEGLQRDWQRKRMAKTWNFWETKVQFSVCREWLVFEV